MNINDLRGEKSSSSSNWLDQVVYNQVLQASFITQL
ncbi:hypothetical protein GWK_03070 [Chlamydia psittaci CP3]|nr:hypothetical protein GWK_03070 [Chlamydia psittaci CP3]